MLPGFNPRNTMKNHKLHFIWNQVPVDYYQKGIRENLFQKIWHGRKISLIGSILGNLRFGDCLDIGCASGYMVSQIAKNYPAVDFYGVDVYDKAINYAKIKYPDIKFQTAPAEKLPFKNESFDLVINVETIEHVEDPSQSLHEIKRVLRKRGTAIVTMDSGSWLFRLVWFVWENSKGSVWRGAHLHPFHHNELEKLIVKTGLKIRKKLFSNLGMEVTFVLGK